MPPDGWNTYCRIGKQIKGTRFIAFKVPLKESLTENIRIRECDELSPRILMNLIPNLGLVIDLTFTEKYYSPTEFLDNDIQYTKIKVEGHVIPELIHYEKFRDTVKQFLSDKKQNGKLIGVHCTHGLNRTGYLVCRYMINEMNMKPYEAIEAFEVARGHKMERQNYINDLKRNKNDERYAYDGTVRTKRCLENRRGQDQHRNMPETPHEIIRKNIAFGIIMGKTVKDLIPDKKGGYLIHISPGEISRNIQSSRNLSDHSSSTCPKRSRFTDDHGHGL